MRNWHSLQRTNKEEQTATAMLPFDSDAEKITICSTGALSLIGDVFDVCRRKTKSIV